MSTVFDYTALLRYLDSDSTRWNGQTAVGTAAVITYSFTEAGDLPTLEEYDPYGSSEYWSYDATHRQLFRDALQQYSDVSGVVFVEVEATTTMINIFGSSGAPGVGGWANYAYSSATSTGQGRFVNEYSNMAPGDYGHQVNLHELGHALGLRHPHEGGTRILDSSLDTQANTVMTYNIEFPYAQVLGGFDIEAMQHLYGTTAGVAGWVVGVTANGEVEIKASGRDETVLGTDQATIIRSAAGNDTIFGRENTDTILSGSGDDVVQAGLGSDYVVGGSGNDVIYGDTSVYSYLGDADTLSGVDGNDWIDGGVGDDILRGGADNDTLIGGSGNDTLLGGVGDDSLDGSDGLDRLVGIGGNDTLNGGSGDDVLVGGALGDTLFGDSGNDTLLGDGGSDSMDGGSGNDRLVGGLGRDTMIGGSGNDTLLGGDSADELNGGTGSDSLVGGAVGDVLNGGDSGDTLMGDDGSDLLNGDGGSDFIVGGVGEDTLMGGSGYDTLQGGSGNDTLNGGLGWDEYTGGTGADVFVFADVEATQDSITDFEQGIDIIDVSAFGITFADITQYSYNGGADTLAYIDGSHPYIVVEGFTPGSLLESDFLFVV